MKALRTLSTNRRLALVILIMLAGLSAVLLWATGSWAQSPIPHAVSETPGDPGVPPDCLACHQAGVNGAGRLAEDHIGRGNEDCLFCHQYTGAPPSYIPHPVEGQEDCLGCHEAAVGNAGPIAGDHVDYENEQCLDCHHVAPGVPTPMPALPTPTPAPSHVQGTTSSSDCFDCHQIIPVDDRHNDIVMQGAGDPAEGEMLFVEHCSSCHGEDGKQTVETTTGEELAINSLEFLAQRDDAAIIVRIATGLEDLMPAFGPDAGGPLTWSEVRSVAAFVRGWAPNAIPVPIGGDLVNGVALYAEHCAACHGTEGQGGPPAREPINTLEYLAGIDDDALRQVILEGTVGMPGLGYRLSDEQVTDLVTLMRSWQRR